MSRYQSRAQPNRQPVWPNPNYMQSQPLPYNAPARYKPAQTAMGSTTGADRLDNTVEAYIGRVEGKYDRIQRGQPIDAGHQAQINGLGNSFRNQTNLPRYNQPDPYAPTVNSNSQVQNQPQQPAQQQNPNQPAVPPQAGPAPIIPLQSNGRTVSNTTSTPQTQQQAQSQQPKPIQNSPASGLPQTPQATQA